MRTLSLCVLFFAASVSSFILTTNKPALLLVRRQPLAAETLQDAAQDAFAYFSQLPPEQVQDDLMQRGEWYELAQFPSEILVTPEVSVEGSSSRVSIQTGLYQENGDWVIYRFQGETDATVLRGLIQILSDITQEVPISEVMSLSPYDITNVLGLQSALSQTDSNDMSAVWNALQQQIEKALFGDTNESNDSENEPSTLGTSIPGAGSAKPSVKKGWGPGSSSSNSGKSNTPGTAPPFAIWDPTSASSSQSTPATSSPSSSSSDRLSRLDRLSSPSTPKFADGAEVDASASKAPWDNWTPPPKAEENTKSSTSEAPSTLGTSIPGAGSAKPSVKKGWGPGSSSGGSSQSSSTGTAPPFAIWDPTSASAQGSPVESAPSSSPSDRLSRLDRLSSSSTPKFADGAEVDASASKAPWDNWTPPPKTEENTKSTSSEAPSTLGTSIPGAGSAKPSVKKGWGPGSSSANSSQSSTGAADTAPPFAIWDPTSASAQGSPAPAPSSSSSPSDRLSRLDRLSSSSTPKFEDGAEVDASASKAPWDNWTPPPKTEENTKSTSSEAPSTMGTSIPGAGSAKPSVKKGWGPGSSSANSSQSSTGAADTAPPFAIWDPTSASAQGSPAPAPSSSSSSPSDRLSRLDRLSSPSTPKFEDGAEIDASASKAPWDTWTPPPKVEEHTKSSSSEAPSTMGTSIPVAESSKPSVKKEWGPGSSSVGSSQSNSPLSTSSSDRLSRLDRVSSPSFTSTKFADGAEVDTSATKAPSDDLKQSPSLSTATWQTQANRQHVAPPSKAPPTKTARSNSTDVYSKFVAPSESASPIPKSPWKADPSPLRTTQSSLNPLSGKAPDQRWRETPIQNNDILQPQEVTSSSFKSSNTRGTENFVQNSKKVFDSIPKSESAQGSSLGPDFIESDRYKIKVPTDASRSAPSNPWRQPTSTSPAGESRVNPLNLNTPVASKWKTSDGIDPLPFTPPNLQTPGMSSGSNPFSSSGVGPQNTITSTPWTGSTPSTAGSARVTLQPQNFSPATGTMSAWTGSTPSKGPQPGSFQEMRPPPGPFRPPPGPFQEKKPWGSQADSESWTPAPSKFPTKLGDFTTEVKRKPKEQTPGANNNKWNQSDKQSRGSTERESFQGRSERVFQKESAPTNSSLFDAEILKDSRSGRQTRGSTERERSGTKTPKENQYQRDSSNAAPFGSSFDRDVSQAASQPGTKRSNANPPRGSESERDHNIGDSSASDDTRKKPKRPRTYLDIVTGNYERTAVKPPRRAGKDEGFSGSSSRGAWPGSASKSQTQTMPEKEVYPFANGPRGDSTTRAPFRGADQRQQDLNERGYEARRSPFNTNVPRSRSESYRNPPRRPDQKPYVDRIIPTRPFGNEEPPYPPYGAPRMNDERWQQRESRIPPPGPREYYDYRGEGPRRPGDESFGYNGDDAWRYPGQGPGPRNVRYDR